MPRWVATCIGIVVVALSIWVVARGFHPPKAIGRDPRAAEDAGIAADAGVADAEDDGGAGPSEIPPEGAAAPSQGWATLRADGGPGTVLPDGRAVPDIPPSAPHQVRFGVILVAYAGTQSSTGGAGIPRTAGRSKRDAKTLADKLVISAGEDFRAAVAQGDPGSADDLGRVKLGVLEPAPEYVLFTLPVGGVGGPVDTPRGYWIVKRLE